ncbi:MAG: YciI family protein [Myxococcales bacterium FL481]|nr:MAG: YciI family protein [Myxococcales bacterium FL481]
MSEKATYALLIYCTTDGHAAPEGAERALVGHRAVQAEAEHRGDLRAVAKLDAVQTARTVRGPVGHHEVTDGPYIDTKEWLVGFYLLDCASEAEALSRAKQLCPGTDHAIEVRPVAWRWER